MHKDQHSIELKNTARVLRQSAYAHQEYLKRVFGRDFVLSTPIEIRGPVRMKARFVAEKDASGEHHAPYIDLWIEFNPAMGLYTVRGEYWDEKDSAKPAFQSSPRSGFDYETLRDPARLFDWLGPVATFGESTDKASIEAVAEALAGMMTPAGNIVDADLDMDGGVMVLRLEPEYRMPVDYFVSGTHFPGMGAPDNEEEFAHTTDIDDWYDSYVEPVQYKVQATLDNLYGTGSFSTEIDEEGFIYVRPVEPIPPQNFESVQPTRPVRKTWYSRAILRMAGVDGRERLSENRLSEATKGKKKAPAELSYTGKSKTDLKKFNDLVRELEQQKKAGAGIRNPMALAHWIGLRMAGMSAHGESVDSGSNITQRMKALLKK